MAANERLDDSTVELIARRALAQNPTAPAATMGVDGRFCPPPPGVPVEGHPLVVKSHYRDFVGDRDKAKVVATWVTAEPSVPLG